MLKITEISHLFIEKYLKDHEQDSLLVVDATCGKGNDSKFILDNLNDKSKLICYDIQDEAIEETTKLLFSSISKNYEIIKDSFVNIKDRVDLVIFNLGFLPGGSKEIYTLEKDSLITIKRLALSNKDNPNFLAIVAVYPGHAEGLKESLAIDEFIRTLDPKIYLCQSLKNVNQNNAPYLVMIKTKVL